MKIKGIAIIGAVIGICVATVVVVRKASRSAVGCDGDAGDLCSYCDTNEQPVLRGALHQSQTSRLEHSLKHNQTIQTSDSEVNLHGSKLLEARSALNSALAAANKATEVAIFGRTNACKIDVSWKDVDMNSIGGKGNFGSILRDFVTTMLAQKERLADFNNEVVDCASNVKDLIVGLEARKQELLSVAKSKCCDVFVVEITEFFETVSRNYAKHIESVARRIQDYVRAINFSKTFEGKFTVAVCGKPKSGKTYLGNFVRGSYFGAPVGMTHKSSRIEYFELGGMIWFDLPGIGSVSGNSEQLAWEYAKNADLVIFACNSDAAGTRQDFQELKQLYDMGKPILLLLTQSDLFECDVDENGDEFDVLVPKSAKDRSDVENYVIQTLREYGISDLLKYEVLTVSTKLSVEAIKYNDNELFDQSNMGAFLQRLIAIIADNGSEIKRNTPRKRANVMIDGIVSDLRISLETLTEAFRKIEAKKEELIERERGLVDNIQSKMFLKTMRIVQCCKERVEADKVMVSEDELSEQINNVLRDCVEEVLAEESIPSTDAVRALSINFAGIGDLKMQQDRIAYNYISKGSDTIDNDGARNELTGDGDRTNHRAVMRRKVRYSTFDTGINDVEIMQNIRKKLEIEGKNSVAELIHTVVSGYYRPLEELCRGSVIAINSAITDFSALKMSKPLTGLVDTVQK